MNHVTVRAAVGVVGVATLSVAGGLTGSAAAEGSDDVSDPVLVDVDDFVGEDLLDSTVQLGGIVDAPFGDPTAPPRAGLTVASVGFVDEVLLVS